MDDKMMDRLFDQIDLNAAKVENLSRIVHENATTLGILSKIVIFIILTILSGAIALGWNSLSTKKSSPPNYYIVPTKEQNNEKGESKNGNSKDFRNSNSSKHKN